MQDLKKAVNLSIVLIGFTAMASQIILMREFLIVFYGNELSIGFILASWLIGGAFGSALLGAFADRIKSKITVFSLCQIALAVLLPLSIIAIRSIKSSLNMTTGEIVPFSPMIISNFVIITPICIILGFMFSLACSMYEDKSRLGAVRAGKVYMLEAIGSMIGGALASFILIRLLDPIHILAALSLANILAALFLQSSSNNLKFKPFFITITTILLIFVILMWPLKGWGALNKFSLKKEWAGYDLVASKNSIYGNVAIAKTEDQYSLFNNGLNLYTIPDKLTSEEAVHFALLEHPSPKSVLLVGGGVELVEEAAKHPAGRIDYVDLDPLIINMSKEYLPAEYTEALKDRRISINNTDGRLFIKRAKETYDCIIIHVGDPNTAELNRYYTLEFFKEARRVLKDDGVMAFSITCSENYINSAEQLFLTTIYHTYNKVFSDIKVIPGDTAYFIASPKKGFLTYDYRVLMERAKERGLDLKYVREYYLFSKLSKKRVLQTEGTIIGHGHAEFNHDFRPISYYYNMIFWATYFRDSFFIKILKSANEDAIWKIVYSVCVLILLFGIAGIQYKRFYRKAALAAIMVTGFSQIVFQILALLAFQIIYGYLFYELGVILTSFMIGLALGGYLVIKTMPRIKKDMLLLITTQGAVALYALVLPIFFLMLAKSRNQGLSWLGANMIFPFLAIVAGLLGGFQFPLANKIYIEEDKRLGRTTGLNYGVDLLGSCLGALLTATFLIPVMGITKTCLIAAMINISVMIVLVISNISNHSNK